MKHKLVAMLSILIILSLGFAFRSETTITVKGSDTMVILGQRWAEEFMKKNTNTIVQVTGGGSGTGISALLNGTTDICNSSRPMKKEEKARLKEKFGTAGVEVKCAIDGLSIYVNSSNSIKEISLSQIRDIFTGKIKNWKELGGKDQPIILYSRENNSGTYVYFKDEVLQGADFDSRAQNMPGTAAVVNAVTKDKNGIGYGGVAYGKGIKELLVKKDAASPSFEPTLENIKNGKYPLGRYLYMYLKNKPSGEIKKYVDWILSPDGQKIVSSVGYIPIR